MGSSATEGSIDLFLDSWARIGWGRLEEKVTDYRWISERHLAIWFVGKSVGWNDGFQRGVSHLVCWEVLCVLERWISERRKPSGLLGRHPFWNRVETTGQCLRFFEWIGFLEVAPLC